MEELQEMEEDAGLGNGGLGRLAGKQNTHYTMPLFINTVVLYLLHY